MGLQFRCFIGLHKWGCISPCTIPSFRICKLCKKIVTPAWDGYDDVWLREISYERCVEALLNFRTSLTKEEAKLLESARPKEEI